MNTSIPPGDAGGDAPVPWRDRLAHELVRGLSKPVRRALLVIGLMLVGLLAWIQLPRDDDPPQPASSCVIIDSPGATCR